MCRPLPVALLVARMRQPRRLLIVLLEARSRTRRPLAIARQWTARRLLVARLTTARRLVVVRTRALSLLRLQLQPQFWQVRARPIESIKLTTPLQDLDAAGVLRPSDGQEVGSPGRSAGTV